MRALSCTPGTALVIGGRLAALGAITARSVMGTKAPGGIPGSELLAGVVSRLLVVRSVLWKQSGWSARRLPRALSTSAQVTPARAEKGTRSASKKAERIVRNIVFSLRGWRDRGIGV